MSTTRISIYCPKGGTGRTTLAVHLADLLAARGLRVMLHDADPQGSALGWAYLAEQVRTTDEREALPFTVGRGGAGVGFDVVLTDHGPADSTIVPAADIYIVPVSLDGVAQAVGLRTLAKLDAAGLAGATIPVASKYRPDRAEHRAALALPALAGALVIRDRACLAGWYATGRTIYDTAHGRAQGVLAARQDINAVGDAILARIPDAEEIGACAGLRDIFGEAA